MRLLAEAAAAILLIFGAAGAIREVRRIRRSPRTDDRIQRYLHAGMLSGAAGVLGVLLVERWSPSLAAGLAVAGVAGLAGFFVAAERLERRRSDDGGSGGAGRP